MSDISDPRPLVAFPPGVVDVDGRRLRPGAAVVFADSAGRPVLGEVVGWAGRRGVEVFVDASNEVIAVSPMQLTRSDDPLANVRSAGWWVFEPDEVVTAVLFPVGGRDVVLAAGDPGPFPTPDATEMLPGGRRDVPFRRWCLECLHAVADECDDEQARLVVAHLDAPMLRRVLTESALPADLHRLVFVVTDQDPPDPRDTAPAVQLLRLWLLGNRFLFDQSAVEAPAVPVRWVRECAEPLVIRHAPHITDSVMFAVRRELPRVVDGCQRVVVVHAGGTPAMTYGAMLAAVAYGGVPVRHIQVPEDRRTPFGLFRQALVEMDISDLPEAGPVLERNTT